MQETLISSSFQVTLHSLCRLACEFWTLMQIPCSLMFRSSVRAQRIKALQKLLEMPTELRGSRSDTYG